MRRILECDSLLLRNPGTEIDLLMVSVCLKLTFILEDFSPNSLMFGFSSSVNYFYFSLNSNVITTEKSRY